MKISQILQEIETSHWQPKFKFENDLNKVVDSILLPHEDYFLGLHSKVEDIILSEVDYFRNSNHDFIIDTKLCFTYQSELFKHKQERILNKTTEYDYYVSGIEKDSEQSLLNIKKAFELPNQYINLGLRKNEVKVGKWTPPSPIYLEFLLQQCFKIIISIPNKTIRVDGVTHDVSTDENLLEFLTNWYKLFETIHFLEDLNGRVGGIIINIISKLICDKYVMKNFDN